MIFFLIHPLHQSPPIFHQVTDTDLLALHSIARDKPKCSWGRQRKRGKSRAVALSKSLQLYRMRYNMMYNNAKFHSNCLSPPKTKTDKLAYDVRSLPCFSYRERRKGTDVQAFCWFYITVKFLPYRTKCFCLLYDFSLCHQQSKRENQHLETSSRAELFREKFVIQYIFIMGLAEWGTTYWAVLGQMCTY